MLSNVINHCRLTATDYTTLTIEFITIEEQREKKSSQQKQINKVLVTIVDLMY